MPRALRTTDIARELGVHVNTVRLYEASGWLPHIPRAANGYRQYTPLHLEQARLAHMALTWPYIGDKTLLLDLVTSAASGDLGRAMELAYQYLAAVRMEQTLAEAAIEFLERWAAGFLIDSARHKMHIREAARYLDVSVDMLRNWERNGLIDVPRDPVNRYRLYGTVEFGRLRVIRVLVKSGYSLMAILQMFRQFDAGKKDNLRDALEIPPDADQTIPIIADRWLTSLLELEVRAQSTIRHLSHMIEITHAQ